MMLLLKRQPARGGAVGRDMVKSAALAALLSFASLAAGAQTAHAPPGHIVSTGDFNVNGNIAAGSLIGAKVRNANGEAIGKVDEVFLDRDAKVTLVAISVGGFLGVGAKEVGVKWSDLGFGNEDNALVVTTSLSKDALMALPDYDRTGRHKVGLPQSIADAPARPNPRQSR